MNQPSPETEHGSSKVLPLAALAVGLAGGCSGGVAFGTLKGNDWLEPPTQEEIDLNTLRAELEVSKVQNGTTDKVWAALEADLKECQTFVDQSGEMEALYNGHLGIRD